MAKFTLLSRDIQRSKTQRKPGLAKTVDRAHKRQKRFSRVSVRDIGCSVLRFASSVQAFAQYQFGEAAASAGIRSMPCIPGPTLGCIHSADAGRGERKPMSPDLEFKRGMAGCDFGSVIAVCCNLRIPSVAFLREKVVNFLANLMYNSLSLPFFNLESSSISET